MFAMDREPDTTPMNNCPSAPNNPEMALRESEAQYRSLYTSMNEGVALHRLLYDPAGKAVDYLLTGVNPAYETILGLKEADVLGRKGSALYGRPEAPFLEEYARVVATGQPAKFETTYAPLGKSFRISAFPTSRDQFATVFEDITARKQAEAERERLMAAIEQSGEIVFVTATDGIIQYVNPAFVAVTGYSRDEAIGKKPSFLKSGQQPPSLYCELWATITGGRTWKGRLVNKRKDGTLYTEEATISPVRDAAGAIVNFVAIKRNITDHLRMEAQLQQAQKMESVGRLAGGVAHDFNNLLMGIMGYADLCREKIEPAHPSRAWLDEITACAKRSAAITRQLLAFARKQTIAPHVLNLDHAVATMLKLLRRLIGEDIDLAWKPGAPGVAIKIDPSQVDQILANLAVNARDAISGVGTLTIETGLLTLDSDSGAGTDIAPGPYVMLAVSDTGRGMDKATLEHIFEPFFTTKAVGEGTGLGLATVYGIVKQNNGFVHVHSEPGKGSTFRIYLPRHTGSGPDTAERRPPESSPGGREAILLVEDERINLYIGQKMLESLGYRVLTADSPKEARRLAGEQAAPIPLLITDVVMPGMSGRDLAKQLTAEGRVLKVLFMSGYTADIIANRGILDKDVNFLPKPFNRDQLALKVREILETT
jgi:PAS domain S-box-containing protein